MPTIDQVKRCFLFYELLDDEIDQVVNSCVVKSYRDGEIVFKEGDVGRDFYVILSGRVKLTKTAKGREVVISTLHKGEAFGETVLTNESERMANASAVGTLDLLEIDQDTIFALYDKQPRIFGIIMLNLSRTLTTRLHRSNQLITQMHERLTQID